MLFETDWPERAPAIAKRLDISRMKLQAMQDKGDSLSKVNGNDHRGSSGRFAWPKLALLRG